MTYYDQFIVWLRSVVIFPDHIWDWLGQQGGIVGASNFAQTFWGIVNFVMAFLIALAPIMPLLIMLYLIDVGMTSLETGSVQPIGNFAMSVFNLSTQAVGAFGSVLDAVIPL